MWLSANSNGIKTREKKKGFFQIFFLSFSFPRKRNWENKFFFLIFSTWPKRANVVSRTYMSYDADAILHSVKAAISLACHNF